MLIQADATYLPYANKYFHSVIFSPPYWGLRKYAGNQGKEPLGLEASPERYIERMVTIFKDIRRVLRDDGVVWMNMGDCYSGAGHGPDKKASVKGWDGSGIPNKANIASGNLMLIPHHVTIALQNDGWIIRNDIVWHKKNPMPESLNGWRWERCRRKVDTLVGQGKQGKDHPGSFESPTSGGKDLLIWENCPGCKKCTHNNGLIFRKASWRHTRGHEYIFQLVKKMGYYSNREVVKEENSPTGRWGKLPKSKTANAQGDGHHGETSALGQEWTHEQAMEKWYTSGRNPRTVMTLATSRYKGAHYAVYPPALIRPLIAASVPEHCCTKCGQAWAPIIDKRPPDRHETEQYTLAAHEPGSHRSKHSPLTSSEVRGYRPTCNCCTICDHYNLLHGDKSCPQPYKSEPGIVLDPFGGSGTTGMVARALGRRWVVQDISHEYLNEQAKVRTKYND